MDIANIGLQKNENEDSGISRRTLREQVKENLVQRILDGEFAPGDRIVEIRLAQELGISQGAVRESIRELEWMGFLETKPYSGTRVKALSLKDLKKLYPVRAALESLAARLALPNLTKEGIDALESLVDEMVKVSEEGDERGMVERNYAFHRTIILASKNEFLIQSWSMFQFSYWTSLSTAHLSDSLVYLAKRHYEILEALRSGDPERAARAMKQHIEELIKYVDQDSVATNRNKRDR